MFLFASLLKKVEPHISLNLTKRVWKIYLEKMASIFGKKGTHYYLNNNFFSFYFESVMLSTYVHILKSTHILQSTNHGPLSRRYLGGDGGATMYIKSIIKS